MNTKNKKWVTVAITGCLTVGAVMAATTEFVDSVVITTSSTTAPVLSATGQGGVVFGGVLNTGTTPATGAGVRMMWVPRRAAFRAGIVTGAQWDLESVARYSTGLGYDSIASGEGSFAAGYSVTASGERAVAMGEDTSASGVGSVGMGMSVVSSGSSSFASGRLTAAAANYSTALGYSSTASGIYSTAFGDRATASGAYSIAASRATATGNYSTALGLTENASYMGVTIGRYNVIQGSQTGWVSTDPIFVIGTGTTASTRVNGFVVRKNGNVEISGDVVVTGTSSTFTLPRQGDILMGEFGDN